MCVLVCAGIGIRETTGICAEIGILLTSPGGAVVGDKLFELGILLTNPGRTVVGDKLLGLAALIKLVEFRDNDNPKGLGSGLKKEMVGGCRILFRMLWMVVMEEGMIVSTVFVGADDDETRLNCAI